MLHRFKSSGPITNADPGCLRERIALFASHVIFRDSYRFTKLCVTVGIRKGAVSGVVRKPAM